MKLSTRWGTTAASLIFVTIGVIVFVVSSGFPHGTETTLGPGYLPRLLALGLIIFAFINLIMAWLTPDTWHEILEPKILSVFIILGFIYLWAIASFNYYLSTFLFLFISFLILNKKENKKRAYLEDLLSASFLTGAIYLIFGLILDVF
ncbi:MAG: Tripartite tricarboxylate transporter TctB family [Clostridia bacterium]|nr:Tripartite tricarboxylate transporter TctB family [Clostridia bacterium]